MSLVRTLILFTCAAVACSNGAKPVPATTTTTATTPPPPTYPSPPPSAKATEIEALVKKAAAVVDNKGKAAFDEFRKKDSEWFYGDTYLFSYDIDLNVLLNPAFPQREGKNLHGEHDSTGKMFHDEFVRVVKERGEGWVDYLFPKPKTTEPVKKWAYVKGVTIDGKPGIIGAGFYPE